MDGNQALEALNFVSDWAKWLITIETFCIALIATQSNTMFNRTAQSKAGYRKIKFMKILATASVFFFIISIASAAFLLLSLPEIVFRLQPGTNIWLAKDSIIGNVLGFNIQQLAIFESLYFGLGLVSFSLAIILAIWTNTETENS